MLFSRRRPEAANQIEGRSSPLVTRRGIAGRRLTGMGPGADRLACASRRKTEPKDEMLISSSSQPAPFGGHKEIWRSRPG
jgi:hypothetical protein